MPSEYNPVAAGHIQGLNNNYWLHYNSIYPFRNNDAAKIYVFTLQAPNNKSAFLKTGLQRGLDSGANVVIISVTTSLNQYSDNGAVSCRLNGVMRTFYVFAPCYYIV
jgi:hypothetical protein